MPFRLIYDNDPENPNNHAWELGEERYESFEKAEKVGEERDEEEEREYGGVYGHWIIAREASS